MPAGVVGDGWSPSGWGGDAAVEAPSEREVVEEVEAELEGPLEEIAASDHGSLELDLAAAELDDSEDARKTEEIQITPFLASSLSWVPDEEKTQPRIRVDEPVAERLAATRQRDSESDPPTNPQIKVVDLRIDAIQQGRITPSPTIVIAAARVISDAPPRTMVSPLPPPPPPPPVVVARDGAMHEAPASLPAGVLASEPRPALVEPSLQVQVAESELDDAALQLVDVDEAEPDGERRPSRASPPPPPLPAIPRADATVGSRGDSMSLPAAPRLEGSAAATRPKPTPSAAPPKDAAPKRPPPPPSANKLEEDRQKRKQVRQWWERFFSDDYLMTVLPPSAAQIGRQVDFIEASLGLSKGGTVLDVGCGLGLHSIELTKRGYLVVGLDLSLAMITRAAEAAQQQSLKINFVHADIREMEFEGAFDGVICMGTTFGFFDEEANRDVLARLQHGLRPGGRMLLDVVNRDYVIGLQPNLVWFEGDDCVCMEESDFNYFNSRLSVKRTMMREDGRQSNAEYSLRLYALHELGQLVQQLGFRVIEVSGQEAVRGAFFGAHSPRILMLAERRAASRMSTAQQERASVAFPPERGSAEIPKPPKPE